MADVKVVVKAVDQASKTIRDTAGATDDLADSLRGLDSSSQSGIGAFTELYSKIGLLKEGFGAVAGTIREAFEMGKEGAAITQTAQSFDYLLQKVGAAPGLLDKLRAASLNTVDDMTLMSSTTTLLAGAQGELATNLANATPELLEIAKAAQKLNPSLGDTRFLYESLALGIKRAQPDILDNLGLTIKIGEANQKYADELGKTVEELTASEKQQALLNATLDAGKVLMEQAGGNASAAGDAFARLDTATKNLADSLKTQFAPSLASAAEGLTLILTMGQKTAAAWHEHEMVMRQTAGSYEEYVTEMTRAAEAAGMLNINYATAEMYGMGAAVEEARAGLNLLSEEEFYAEQRTAALQLAAQNGQASWQHYYRTTDNTAQSLDKVSDNMAETEAAARRYEEAVEGVRKAEENWTKGAGADAASYLERAGVEGDKYSKALGVIDEVMGTNLAVQDAYQKELEAVSAEYEKTGNLEVYKQKLNEIKDTYMPLNERLEEARNLLQEISGEITEMPLARHVWIYIHEKHIMEAPGAGTVGNDPTNRCFTGDTLVNTPTGYRAIADLAAGDVVSVLTEAGAVEAARVLSNTPAQRADLLRVTLSNGDAITCSPDHPWKTVKGGWVLAGALRPFDSLVSLHVGLFVVDVAPYPGAYPVYDLHVDHPEHTFMVRGVVVHNKEAFAAGGRPPIGVPVLAGEGGREEAFIPDKGGYIANAQQTNELIGSMQTLIAILSNGGGMGRGGGDIILQRGAIQPMFANEEDLYRRMLEYIQARR
jgi:hypothetical protein